MRPRAPSRPGRSHLLALSLEGAKCWLRVLAEIKNRGTRDVCLLVCDGLEGLPDAVSAVWEKTIRPKSTLTS